MPKGKDGEELERFVGFTTSAGHSAVTKYPAGNLSTIRIQYQEGVHEAKAHIFYKATPITTGKEFGTQFLERDTQIENGIKYYNTSAGLHTDKTATALTDDNRTFQLTLESWFAGDNVADVGMILDASGSMAFTSESDNVHPVTLSESQLQQLVSEGVEENQPLTAEQINRILNQNYTDDNKMTYTGYRYFVYDFRDNTQENVPLAYWNGQYRSLYKETEIPAQESLLGYYPFDGNLLNECTGKSATMIEQAKDHSDTFSADYPASGNASFTSSNKKGGSHALSLKNTSANGAVLLDVAPTPDASGNYAFTISFAIRKLDTGLSSSSITSIEPIMDIGSVGTAMTDDTYYQMYRASGGSKNRLKMDDTNGAAQNTSGNINSVFNDSSDPWHVLTYVVDGTTLTAYLDGVQQTASTLNSLPTGDIGVVLAGLLDGQNLEYDIVLDELYLYNSALGSADVKTLYQTIHESAGQPEKTYMAVNDDGETLGLINEKAVFSDTAKAEGWYYVNSGSGWDNYINLGTEKDFRGVIKPESGSYTFHYQDSSTVTFDDLDEDYYPSIFYYKMEGGNPVLYCAFMYGESAKETSQYEASPVYEKSDIGRVKVDSLQAALGVFVSELNEATVHNRVSAVRFSTQDGKDHPEELVLLDWTKDPLESSDILGLNRGTSSTDCQMSVPSVENETDKNGSGILQYNYGLTGGTYTWTGLQAYLQQLDTRIDRSDDNHQDQEKFVVIFTDGKDSNYFGTKAADLEQKYKAIELANELKSKGYSIFCVMLTGGSLDADAADEAEEFLGYLSGTEQASISTSADTVTKTPEDGYVFRAETAEELINQFLVIVDSIRYSLNDYTVQDYVDPRFDLVDAYGNVIYLRDNGEIFAPEEFITKKVEETDYQTANLSASDSYQVTVSLREDYDETAQKAQLYYDSTNHLYYLRWLKAEIPGCSIGASELSVWATQITVRAKDDFLGGNAVLTNGNAENMNMVYAEAEERDEDARSSGTSDMYNKKQNMDADDYPSKGFPRTVVNVGVAPLSIPDEEQTIWLGETLEPDAVIEQLGEQAEPSAYWDYLKRYADYQQMHGHAQTVEEFLERLLAGDQVELPYSYLPLDGEPTQTGMSLHEGDTLGTLTYRLEKVSTNSQPLPASGGTIYYTEPWTYRLTVSYAPSSVRARISQNADLITETKFQDPKDPVGDAQTTKTASGNHTTELVKGDLRLDLHISKDDYDFLKEHSDIRTINYHADILRSYGAVSSMKVGTMTVSIDLDADDSGLQWRDGYTDFPATIVWTSAFRSQGWGDYLPIGTYTVESTSPEAPSWLHFKPLQVMSITDDNASLFRSSVIRAGETASGLAAPNIGTVPNGFYFGTQPTTAGTATRLAHRLGWMRIEIDHDSVTPASLTPRLEKQIIGDQPGEEKTFTFTITADTANPAGGASVDRGETMKVEITGEDIVAATDDITFTKAGTYRFTISEDAVTHNGYTKDDNPWILTVEVEDQTFYMDIVKVTYQQQNTLTEAPWATFTNTYTVKPADYAPQVSKTVENINPLITDSEEREFTFILRANDDNRKGGCSLDSGDETTATATLTDLAGGAVTPFGNLTFTKAGTYTFEIMEQNTGIAGYTYDGEVWTLTVVVTDVDSQLTANAEYVNTKAEIKTQAEFTNKYAVDQVGFSPMIRKQIAGDVPTVQQTFTFMLAADNSEAETVLPAPKYVDRTGIGTAAFEEMTFTQVGTYRFLIQEVPESVNGYAYDSSVWTLEIQVTEDGGALKQTAVYAKTTGETGDGVAVFTNTYRTEPTVYQPKVVKTVVGDAPIDEEFVFDIEEMNGNPVDGAKLPETGTVTIEGSGESFFDAIQFFQAGTYRYRIQERPGTAAGYTYDDSVYILTVTVQDVDAALQVTDAGYMKVGGDAVGECADFENIYRPKAASYAPQVEKKISGDNRTTEETFAFRIQSQSENPEGVIMPIYTTALVTGEGVTTFEDLIFTKAGVYVFHIQERNDAAVGYVYDNSLWTLTVTVTDVDAVLQIDSVTYAKQDTQVTSDTQALFENEYKKPAEPPTTEDTPSGSGEATGQHTDSDSADGNAANMQRTDAPFTGDHANVVLWAIWAIVSGATAFVCFHSGKRNGR